jgi:hypothetical protein
MPRALAFLASVAAVGLASPASSAVFTFGQFLSPEAADATGTGYARVTFDTTLRTLRVQASWSGLSGSTSVAHIHCCTASPGTIGVAVTPGTFPGFPVGVKAGTYDATLDLSNSATYTANFRNNFGGGSVNGAQAALLLGLQQNLAYLNIHTDIFPSGEIRGFLTAVPEPASWALMIAGFGMAGITLRRRAEPAPA